jgi:membrane associated rhomboid family serine protease
MTIIIIFITVIVSVAAFFNQPLRDKFIFNPYIIRHNNEWFRFLTSGFLHADWIHLAVNMFVLFSFGTAVENYYAYFFGHAWKYYYLLMYLASIVAANVSTFYKYQDSPHYNALGASGAVSAVLFASILFQPLTKIYIYGLIGIPGIVGGVLYLVYSHYASRRGHDNINHEAHFYGAVFGILYTIVLKPSVVKFFLSQLAAGF